MLRTVRAARPRVVRNAGRGRLRGLTRLLLLVLVMGVLGISRLMQLHVLAGRLVLQQSTRHAKKF